MRVLAVLCLAFALAAAQEEDATTTVASAIPESAFGMPSFLFFIEPLVTLAFIANCGIIV